MSTRTYLTVLEAACYLTSRGFLTHENTVRRWARLGLVPTRRPPSGRPLLIPRVALDAVLNCPFCATRHADPPQVVDPPPLRQVS